MLRVKLERNCDAEFSELVKGDEGEVEIPEKALIYENANRPETPLGKQGS